MRDNHDSKDQVPRTARLWFGLLAAPSLWFLHLCVAYVLAPVVCTTEQRAWLDLITLISGAGALAALTVAWNDHRQSRRLLARLPHDSDAASSGRPAAQGTEQSDVSAETGFSETERSSRAPSADTRLQLARVRFMAGSGIAVSALFLGVILLEALPIYLIDPCIKIEGPRVWLDREARWLAGAPPLVWISFTHSWQALFRHCSMIVDRLDSFVVSRLCSMIVSRPRSIAAGRLVSVIGSIVTTLSWTSTARAHAGEVRLAPEDAWQAWNGDPWIVGSLLFATWLYLRGVRRLWRRKRSTKQAKHARRMVPLDAGPTPGIAPMVPWRVLAHLTGLAVAAVALLSPLDAMSGALFSAHMAQHILLMSVIPPLLLLGDPARAYRWALSTAWRAQLARLVQRSRLHVVWKQLHQGWIALALYTTAVWIWHAPVPYAAALASDLVHALEHLCFISAALLLWSSADRHAKRHAHGTSVLLLFGAMLQASLLGLLATVSATAWYPAHHASALAWGLTPLEDQQLAGLIMWIPGSIPITLGALAHFYRWLRAAEATGQRDSLRRNSLKHNSPQHDSLQHDSLKPVSRKHTSLQQNTSTIVVCLGFGLLAACAPLRDPPPNRQVPGGDPAAGRRALAQYGCGACHVIPDVEGAKGRTAAPLENFGDRSHIAGVLSNTPDNLIRWIVEPQAIVPGTAMPNLGVTEVDARNMAAHLYTLQR